MSLRLIAKAQDFQPIKSHPEKIDCTYKKEAKKETIHFANSVQPYEIYDKNSSSIELINCEKIQIKDLVFYTILFSSKIYTGSIPHKTLAFEVALLNKQLSKQPNKILNSLQTVRSEVIDQIELSGDLVNTNFDSTIKTEWGLSKKDSEVLLKIEITTINTKPFSYLLKFNPKSLWLENLFKDTTTGTEKTK